MLLGGGPGEGRRWLGALSPGLLGLMLREPDYASSCLIEHR